MSVFRDVHPATLRLNSGCPHGVLPLRSTLSNMLAVPRTLPVLQVTVRGDSPLHAAIDAARAVRHAMLGTERVDEAISRHVTNVSSISLELA